MLSIPPFSLKNVLFWVTEFGSHPYTVSVTPHPEHCSKIPTNYNFFHLHDNFMKQVMMGKLGPRKGKQLSQVCTGNEGWHQEPQ